MCPGPSVPPGGPPGEVRKFLHHMGPPPEFTPTRTHWSPDSAKMRSCLIAIHL